jgi:hypothetical protein
MPTAPQAQVTVGSVTAANTVHRVVLHVRGTTLTFSAGPEGGPLTPRAGSWPIPPDFYLLTCVHYAGASLTLSMA